MACSGLLSCAVLLALGDAWGGAGNEGAPDTGLGVESHAGGASEMRWCPAGTKGGAVTRSCCGELHCKAAHEPSEVADTAGSVGDSACAAGLNGCDEECNGWCSCKAALVLSNGGHADGAGQNGCAVGRSPAAWRLTLPEGMGTVRAAGRATALVWEGCEEARLCFGLPRKMSCACGLRPDMGLLICCSVLPPDAALLEGSFSNRDLLLSMLSIGTAERICTSWASKPGGRVCSGFPALGRLAAGTAMLTWTSSAPMLGGHIHAE